MSLYTELETKQTELTELKNQLSELQDKLKDIENNPEEYADLSSLYDDYLDELYSEECNNLPVCITASELIKEHDPVMYRCGFSDYCSEYDHTSLDIYIQTLKVRLKI